MTANIVNFKGGNLPAALNSLNTGIANAMVETSGGGGEAYMRLDRGGLFLYGQDNTEVQEGSLWAVNVFSVEHGFISWGEGAVLGEVMVPLAQPLPAVDSLPETGEKWDKQFTLGMKCLSGDDTGVEVIYKGTSVGYKKMFNKLMQAVQGQLAAGEEDVIPLVTLEVDFYRHKQYGKIYTPQMVIQKFVAPDTEDPDVSDVEVEEEPAKKSTRKTRSRA